MERLPGISSGLLLALMIGFSSAQAGVGDPFPSFTLQGLDGKVHTPSDYSGQVLMLFFLGHN